MICTDEIIFNQNPHRWRLFSGPGGIRTLDLFGAMDKQVGEKGKKAVFTSKMYQNHHTTRCAPCQLFEHICTRIVHAVYPICIGMKQGEQVQVQFRVGKV